MYTPEIIKSWTAPEAQANFAQLAEILYQTDRYKTQLAEDIGLTAVGVSKWFAEEKRPPVWAFLLVQDRIELRRVSDALRGLSDALRVADTL